jgi:PAS domain S-box-containing protein
LYIVGIIMGITTVITWMVSKHVSKPIKLLTERIHKAEKGELNTEIEIKGNDEIAKINLAFNDLVNTLQDSKKTVEQQEIKLKKQLNDLKFLKKSLNESTYFATSDINGNFTYVNERFCKNTQYTSSELIGNNPRILKSGTHDQIFYKKMWDHLLSGRVWIGDINNKRKDGSMYWVKEILIPKKDIDGKVIEFIIIQTDITHQKTNESDLSTSLNYLTKSQELQNEFLETFFKELPIPVDSIRKLCRTLKYDELGDRLNEDQRKNVNAIYDNTKKIDFILEEFLGMFKPDSKKETTQN